MRFLFWSFFIISLFGSLGYVVASLRLWSVLARPRTGNNLPQSSGLSVMVPLKGTDPNTETSLRGLLEAKAPEKTEYLFVMETAGDPAYKLCQKLKHGYPDKDIRILLSGAAGARMGKQHNLAAALKRSRFEVVASMDADVLLAPGTLTETFAQLSEAKAGTVFALPYYAGPGPLGGQLVAVYTNYYIMPFVGALASTGRADFILGAFWMSTKRALAATGGLEPLTAYVNDDAALGKAMVRAGYKNTMLEHPVTLALEAKRLAGGFKHLQKWVAMLRAEGLGRYLSIVLFWHPVLFAVLALFTAQLADLSHLISLGLFAFSLAVRVGSLLTLNGAVYKGVARAKFLLWLLPYELLVVPVLFGWGFFKRDLSWRGTRYVVGPGGKIISAEKV